MNLKRFLLLKLQLCLLAYPAWSRLANGFLGNLTNMIHSYSFLPNGKEYSSDLTCSTGISKSMGQCITSMTACEKMKGKAIGKCQQGICCEVFINASDPNVTKVVTQPAVTLKESGIKDAISIFEFPKQPGTCQLVLQFLDTMLENPSTGVETAGNCVSEWVFVSGSNSIQGDGTITVCGDLRNQHMYLSYQDDGFRGPSDKITLSVKSKKFSINVAQVSCQDPKKIPTFCLQHYKSDSETFKSFGYPIQLNNQYYHICTTATQQGARATTWEECDQSTTGGKRPFFVSGSRRSQDGSFPLTGVGHAECTTDYVSLSLKEPAERYCGGFFPTVTAPIGFTHFAVSFNGDNIGHSSVLRRVPKGLSCSDIEIPYHICEPPKNGLEPEGTCVCVFDTREKIIIENIPVKENEQCPTVDGYVCSKDMQGGLKCSCVQSYNEAEQENTGFCIKYTHHY